MPSSTTLGAAPAEGTNFLIGKRYFGVEIEYGDADPEALKPVLRSLGLNVTRTWREGGWNSGYDSDGELRSPLLKGADGEREVRLACDALEELGATTCRYHGLHVHHDVRALGAPSILRLLKNYEASQPAIRQLVDSSRWHNGSCTELDRTRIARMGDRPTRGQLANYAHRNAMSTVQVDHYGSVEFRQHHGTVDADEILAWVAFGQALIAASVAAKKIAAKTVEELVEALSRRLSPMAAEFLLEKSGALVPA